MMWIVNHWVSMIMMLIGKAKAMMWIVNHWASMIMMLIGQAKAMKNNDVD